MVLVVQNLLENPVSGIRQDHNNNVIGEFRLAHNYPNPFNSNMVISFEITSDIFVELTIFNLKGQKIASMVSENMNAGRYDLTWGGKDYIGRTVPSGIYLYTIRAGNNQLTKKMSFIRKYHNH